MDTYQFMLQPLSAFGTPIAGDTLFGQLCWAIRERLGEGRLAGLLKGYTEGRPFLVVSDAFPAGWLPRPQLPDFLLGIDADPAQRKAAKQRTWLPVADSALPLDVWMTRTVALKSAEYAVLMQNTINRLTGTTGSGAFAPRQVERLRFPPGSRLHLYCCLDASRLEQRELLQALVDIGASGFGRDATTGLGKFAVEACDPWVWPVTTGLHALTLAPCAPESRLLDSRACFYQPLTRFGRHGNVAAVSGQPFKRPVMGLRTAAFLTFRSGPVPPFHGTGLGGLRMPISAVIPATVHQGYSPLVPLHAELRS